MKMLRFLLLALTPLASAQTYYNQTTAPPLPPKNPILYAAAYGHCTWDATHDTSACINAAIAKAATAGGGTVMIPCGTFGISSQIENHTSGVKLQGCGNGPPRQAADTSKVYSATRLLWIGAVTANPALVVQTASGGGVITTNADVWGITVDCNNICAKAIQISGVSYSMINIEGAEATSINIEFTTPTDLSSTGSQHNDIWAYSRSTSNTNSPTGILFDGGCLSCTNTSYDVIHILYAWYTKGDGIVFGDSDNLTVELLRDFPSTGATGTGVVVANANYTPPNGVVVKNYGRAIRSLHTGSHGIHVLGFNTGSTFTAAGGNGGSAALNPLTISTSGTAAISTSTLTFASTTGAAIGEQISCGGPVNGLFNGTPVGTVTSTTISIAPAELISTMASSTSCTITYGFTQQANPGTYTLTATAASVYTLTAPSGGHTQTGIVPSGGLLTFTDMVIPWTGSASVNDSWTIVAPEHARRVWIEDIDKDNNLPVPTFEPGSYGYWSQDNLGYPIVFGTQCIINSMSGLGGTKGTATGGNACVLGGIGGGATGSYSLSLGGTGNASFGFATTALGQNSSVGGADSLVAGNGGTDRIRPLTNCWGGNEIAVQGDSQTCYTVLNGTGASTSAIRLTANSAAANAGDCVNIPNNTAYALTMDIVAFDHTTVTKNNSWNNLTGLLTRGANAASTTVTLTSATPAVTYSNGAANGTMSITADTTNGCLNVSWTPPALNTDTWNVVARVRTVEVQ